MFLGVEFLEKLAVLTPAPRANLCRYHGVFAPGAKWRGTVVRDRAPADSNAERCARIRPATPGKADSHDSCNATVPILEVAQGDPVGLRERRLTWSELLQRVFREDVLRCKKCGGRAEIISAITQPKVVEAILICLGHTTRAPPIAPARQTPFEL